MAQFQDMTNTDVVNNDTSVVCIKAHGIAVDENGALTYGGVKIRFNGITLPPFPELIAKADPMVVLSELGLLDAFEVTDAQFITQEEYDRDYGDEDTE